MKGGGFEGTKRVFDGWGGGWGLGLLLDEGCGSFSSLTRVCLLLVVVVVVVVVGGGIVSRYRALSVAARPSMGGKGCYRCWWSIPVLLLLVVHSCTIVAGGRFLYYCCWWSIPVHCCWWSIPVHAVPLWAMYVPMPPPRRVVGRTSCATMSLEWTTRCERPAIHHTFQGQILTPHAAAVTAPPSPPPTR